VLAGLRNRPLAYNLTMKNSIGQLVGAAVMPRLALFINHVLAAEPAAVDRLRAHAGKRVRLQMRDASPLVAWLPTAVTACVTPAGLIEWTHDESEVSELVITVDASQPAQMVADTLSGDKPPVDVAGDAAFAADVNWLVEHLRWDVQDDLARVIGVGPATQLTQAGAFVAAGLRRAVQMVNQATGKRSHTGAAASPSTPSSAEPPAR
jgi:ubiquinone biosynthesis accessory factor UbiJ